MDKGGGFMIKNKLLLAGLLLTIGITLVSCGKSSDSSISSKEDKVKTESTNSEEVKSETDKKQELEQQTESNSKLESKDENSSNLSKNTNDSHSSKNTKAYYIEKLDNIEKGMSDLDEQYAGTTYDMRMAANEEYKRWDDALNEIYGVLKTQLSDSEMKALSKEEQKWIEEKERKASEEAKKYEGGTIAPVIHMSSLAKSTKERCYELVNKYMK